MIKALYFGFFILAAVFLADAGLELRSGQAEVMSPGAGGVRQANREKDPQAYQGLMNYQWARAGLVGLAGYILFSLKRRQDQLDPFSAHFQGQEAIDELVSHVNNKKRDSE